MISFDTKLKESRSGLYLIDKKELMRSYDFRSTDNVHGLILALIEPFPT